MSCAWFFQIQSLFSFVWPYARPETNIFVVVNRYDNTILFWHKIHFKQAANNLLFFKMGLSLITADQNVLNKYFWFKPFPLFRRTQHSLSGYINDGDGCWRRNMLVTSLRY